MRSQMSVRLKHTEKHFFTSAFMFSDLLTGRMKQAANQLPLSVGAQFTEWNYERDPHSTTHQMCNNNTAANKYDTHKRTEREGEKEGKREKERARGRPNERL